MLDSLKFIKKLKFVSWPHFVSEADEEVKTAE